jgi:hypothetical protein
MSAVSPWLTDDELAELTGYSWRSKQQHALAVMGIAFKVNPRGRILVLRAVLGEKPTQSVRPDWSAMKGKAA